MAKGDEGPCEGYLDGGAVAETTVPLTQSFGCWRKFGRR